MILPFSQTASLDETNMSPPGRLSSLVIRNRLSLYLSVCFSLSGVILATLSPSVLMLSSIFYVLLPPFLCPAFLRLFPLGGSLLFLLSSLLQSLICFSLLVYLTFTSLNSVIRLVYVITALYTSRLLLIRSHC